MNSLFGLIIYIYILWFSRKSGERCLQTLINKKVYSAYEIKKTLRELMRTLNWNQEKKLQVKGILDLFFQTNEKNYVKVVHKLEIKWTYESRSLVVVIYSAKVWFNSRSFHTNLVLVTLSLLRINMIWFEWFLNYFQTKLFKMVWKLSNQTFVLRFCLVSNYFLLSNIQVQQF